MSSSMAKKNPDYAPKSPRGRPHDVVALVFDYVEDAIHVLVAALLVIAGGFVLQKNRPLFFARLARRCGAGSCRGLFAPPAEIAP